MYHQESSDNEDQEKKKQKEDESKVWNQEQIFQKNGLKFKDLKTYLKLVNYGTVRQNKALPKDAEFSINAQQRDKFIQQKRAIMIDHYSQVSSMTKQSKMYSVENLTNESRKMIP